MAVAAHILRGEPTLNSPMDPTLGLSHHSNSHFAAIELRDRWFPGADLRALAAVVETFREADQSAQALSAILGLAHDHEIFVPLERKPRKGRRFSNAEYLRVALLRHFQVQGSACACHRQSLPGHGKKTGQTSPSTGGSQ